MGESEAIAALRAALKAYLAAVFGGYQVDRDDDFVVRWGSATVFVRALEQEGRTFAVIWSATNLEVPISGELTRFLATENAGLPFGKFALNEDPSGVLLVHALLGDFLNRDELETAVKAVAETADQYDDEIRARFGGRLPAEIAAAALAAEVRAAEEARGAEQPDEPDEPPDDGHEGVRTLFAFLALVAAIAGAILAYVLVGSIWLALFVALFALYAVGRGAADVVTDPDKLRRGLYFLLLPALATGVLVAAYALWGRWWLATLLGLLGGVALNAILAPRLFPRIHREELLDTQQRSAGRRGR